MFPDLISRIKGANSARAYVILAFVLVVFGSLQLLASEIGIQETVFKIFRRLVDSMLLAIPLMWCRRRCLVYTYLSIILLIVESNLLYYRYYTTLMPMSSYLMVQNVSVIETSVVTGLRIKDLWLVVGGGAYMVLYSIYYSRLKRVHHPWIYTVAAVLIGCMVIIPPFIKFKTDDPYGNYPITQFRKDRGVLWHNLGTFEYLICSMALSLQSDQESLDRCLSFMDSYRHRRHAAPLSGHQGRNLIVLVVESLQSWPVGLEIGNVEVTPVLNSIVSDTTALYFPRMLPQVNDGRSADAFLMFNTGLLPARTGITSVLYGANVYPSLSKALTEQGYNSLMLTCDMPQVWNIGDFALNIGFDKVYPRMGFVDDSGSQIHSDEYLVDNALDIIPKHSEPLYAMLVTYSGHDIVDSDLPDPFPANCDMSSDVRNALKIYRYEDTQIGRLIDGLRKCGLYDRSVVVIVGDHDNFGLNRYQGRSQTLLTDRYVPLIILNAGCSSICTDRVIAQTDLYPTLLDIMGSDYWWRGVGENVIASDKNFAVYKDGTVDGHPRSQQALDRARDDWEISDMIIRTDYFSRMMPDID